LFSIENSLFKKPKAMPAEIKGLLIIFYILKMKKVYLDNASTTALRR
jgi:hypothetical protein